MKKILTFLMVFAMTAGILSAQNTNLSYQVVVRDANNNLVVNQKVKVAVTITANPLSMVDLPSDLVVEMDPYVEEIEEDSTNANGMLSLSIGQNGDNNFSRMDWRNAVIRLTISNLEGTEVIMTVEQPVYAVPYAEQAGFLLTTDQIVDYLSGVNPTHDGTDVKAIWQALRNREDEVLNPIRQLVVDSLKNHFDFAKRVAYYYMNNKLTGSDIREAYDSVMALDQNVKDAIVANVKRYMQNHRSLALKVAKEYIRTSDGDEVQALYDKLVENTTVYDYVKKQLGLVLDEYMNTHGMNPNCLQTNNFNNLCDLLVAANYMNSNPNDTCPAFTSVRNTAADGLVALAFNQGIILTAYVKNKKQGDNYGFFLSESQYTGYVQQSPVYYQSIPAGNPNAKFGKIVDTMDNSALCGKTLYAYAYMQNSKCQPVGNILSDTMMFTVPTFEIVAPEAGSYTVNFAPAEAQTVFHTDGRNEHNVWWYDAGTYDENHHTGTVRHTGDTYNVAGTYTVVARLGQCYVTKTVTIQ